MRFVQHPGFDVSARAKGILLQNEPIHPPWQGTSTTIGLLQPQCPHPGPRRDPWCGLTSKLGRSLSPCLSNWCPWLCLATHPQQPQPSFSSRLQPGRLWCAPGAAAACNLPAPSVINSFTCGSQTSCHPLPVAWLCGRASLITDNFFCFHSFLQEKGWKQSRGEEHGMAASLLTSRVKVILKAQLLMPSPVLLNQLRIIKKIF